MDAGEHFVTGVAGAGPGEAGDLLLAISGALDDDVDGREEDGVVDGDVGLAEFFDVEGKVHRADDAVDEDAV